jgi:essential nuclear protein 1
MAKLKENELESKEKDNIGDLEESVASTMNPKIVEAYKLVGKILKTYKSGKLPKIFKAIPMLSNWEDILFLTKPEEWSSRSMYEATKIFVSNCEI